MIRISLAIICILLSALNALALEKYSVDDVPNVNLRNRYEFVSDPANLMSAQAKERVNNTIMNLRSATTSEIAVVVVPSIDTDPEAFTEELFRKWKIGKSDKDNGVLLLMAVDDRTARIETGYGSEGVITDYMASRIIREDIAPRMREGDLDGAVSAAVSRMAAAMSDPAAAEELRSEQSNDSYEAQALDSKVLKEFIYGMITCVFFAALIMFLTDISSCRKKDNLRKARIWRSHLYLYIALGIFSAGAGLIFAFMAWWLPKHYRNKPRKCDTCGATMRKLSEEEDNNLLSDSQDLEERLGSVDYDVWECPECGTVERFPFRQEQSKYTECPKCHTVSMSLACDKVIYPPTVKSPGVGERVYECKYCGNRTGKRYSIPKKPDPTAALAAGAIIGSSLGRGGGGGGFGGGFGGGASGGGGATGGW